MTAPTKSVDIPRKNGTEAFHAGSRPLGFSLLDFWQWADSDLVGNTSRGAVAEFLVARSLGMGAKDTRNDWQPFDLHVEGGPRIEVKSAAYVQSWPQKEYSRIVFGTAPKRPWNKEKNMIGPEPERQADMYVFALLAHRTGDLAGDKETVDPMDVDQWKFYVVPTLDLPSSKDGSPQNSITLQALQRLKRPVCFAEIPAAVQGAWSEAKNTRRRASR